MRDWLITDSADRECLYAAQRDGFGAWRPWRGAYARAKRLEKKGLLKKAGFASMPPHIVYVLTDKGREELVVATHIDGQQAPRACGWCKEVHDGACRRQITGAQSD